MAAQCSISVCLRLSQSWGLGVIAFHCCASAGRDPAEITCSVNVRVEGPDGIKQAADLAAAYRDAGADLVIMNLPLAADPAMVEPLAEALTPLA